MIKNLHIIVSHSQTWLTMGFDIFPRLRRVLTALCCVVGVGACSFECPEGNALDHAAIYGVIPSVGYSLPPMPGPETQSWKPLSNRQ